MDNRLIKLYIIEDMREIENILNSNNHDIETLTKIHRKIDSKYQSCIKDWGKGMYGWNDKCGFIYDFLGSSSIITNLEAMLYKLSAFNMNLNNKKKDDNMIFQPIINNNNTNNSLNQLNIQLNFNEIRSNIRNNSTYTSDEKLDILEKIDTLENIYAAKEDKITVWKKIHPIIIWLADKGVDVAITFLPIIFQILSAH